MEPSSQTAEVAPANGGNKRPESERKSDPNLAAALLAAQLAGLQESFKMAFHRMDANAARQDELIASAHTALMEARRILEQCGMLSQRIDGLPTKADATELWGRVASLAGRMDKLAERATTGTQERHEEVTAREALAVTVAKTFVGIPWPWKIVIIVAAVVLVALALVLYLALRHGGTI
jgi:ElaB/YqjD/DUF883 family membrane-anchored ribosome-binding protein